MSVFDKPHGTWCKQPFSTECRKFSTDGTLLGADIAHQFGTTNEEEIKNSDDGKQPFVSDADAEQAEWESTDSGAWGHW